MQPPAMTATRPEAEQLDRPSAPPRPMDGPAQPVVQPMRQPVTEPSPTSRYDARPMATPNREPIATPVQPDAARLDGRPVKAAIPQPMTPTQWSGAPPVTPMGREETNPSAADLPPAQERPVRHIAPQADQRAEPVRAVVTPEPPAGEKVNWDAIRGTRTMTPPENRPVAAAAGAQDVRRQPVPPVQPESTPPARPVRPWWLRGPGEVAQRGAEPVAAPSAPQSHPEQRGGERARSAQVHTGQPVSAGRPGIEEPEGVFSWRPVEELTDEPALRPSLPRDSAPAPLTRTAELTDTIAHGARMAGRGEALGSDLLLAPKVAAVSSQTAYWIRSSFRLGRRESVVTLDPPDLGRLRISLREDGPRLIARIQTELPEVASILREGSEAIRERLESQGLRIDTLIIESVGPRAERPVASGSSQGEPHTPDDPGASAQERRGDPRQTPRSAGVETMPEAAAEEMPPGSGRPRRLDLRA